jgi:hypothetical protein
MHDTITKAGEQYRTTMRSVTYAVVTVTLVTYLSYYNNVSLLFNGKGAG